MEALKVNNKLMNGCASQYRGHKNNGDYFVDSFEDTSLRNELLCRIYAEGLEKPTILQQNLIIPWLRGHDCIIHARRQTGKKTALAIAVLQAIDADIQQCQVLILVPHKQRALAVLNKLNDLCDFEDLQCHIATSLDPQVDTTELGTAVHVVIATVRSAHDLIQRRVLTTDFVKMVVFEDTIHMHSSRNYRRAWAIFRAFRSDTQLILMSTIASVDSSDKSRRHLPSADFEGEVTETDIKQISRSAVAEVRKLKTLFNVRRKVKLDTSQFVIFFGKNLSAVNPKEQMQNQAPSQPFTCIENLPKSSNYGTQEKTEETLNVFEEELSSEKVSKNLLGTVHNKVVNKGCDCSIKCQKNGMKSRRACEHELRDVLNMSVDTYDSKTENSFDQLNLSGELLHGIYAHNLREPTPLQAKVIVRCTQLFDVVVQGLPGTGKKIAASIVALQSVEPNLRCCQVLILTSDRYTAQYYLELLNHLGKYMKVWCYSVSAESGTIGNLSTYLTGAHIVIGTPSTAYKAIQCKILATDHIKLLVLGDACQMISKKIQSLICSLVVSLNLNVQKVLLSDFMTVKHVKQLTKFVESPIHIVPVKGEFTPQNYRQFFIEADVTMKFKILCSLYKALRITKAVIYCNSKEDVQLLTIDMQSEGFKVSAIHNGIMNQGNNQILNNFFSAGSHALITVDLIESSSLPCVDVVINFQVAVTEESYIQRIRRHPKGTFISMVSNQENKYLQGLRMFFNAKIMKMQRFDAFLREFSASGVAQDAYDDKIVAENNNSLDFIFAKYFYSCNSVVENSFNEMNLCQDLLEGIQQSGFVKPTPLQHSAIIPVLRGYDVAIQASPKTGRKTFISIAALQSIDYSSKYCQALILSNEWENTINTYQVLRQLCHKAKVHCCCDKQSLWSEIPSVMQAHIVLGSPQRLSALIRKKALQTNEIKIVVLDTNKMFSDASKNDISDVLSMMDSTVQVLLLFPSMERWVLDFFGEFLEKPFALVVDVEDTALKNNQFYTFSADKIKKLEIIHNLFKKIPITEAVIFSNTNEEASLLSKGIERRKVLTCTVLDSACQNNEAQQLHCNCVISVVKSDTEICNEQQKSVYINYSLHCKSCYVDRIKQIYSPGKDVFLINFVTEEEMTIMNEIIDTYRINMVRLISDH